MPKKFYEIEPWFNSYRQGWSLPEWNPLWCSALKVGPNFDSNIRLGWQ